MKFEKGGAYNPLSGKKKTLPVRKKPKQIARQMLEDKSPLIMQKVIAMGLDGDTTCLEMLVDRILPTHKAVDAKQTKTDYAININVGTLEQLPSEVIEAIDVTPTEVAIKEIQNDKQSD